MTRIYQWPFMVHDTFMHNIHRKHMQRMIDGTWYHSASNAFYADDGFGNLIAIPLNHSSH